MSGALGSPSGWPSPLFRDPVTDGAADPTVIRHHETGEWWMFYTRRRPADTGPGVTWVHGSRIGVARSHDGWHWRAAGVVEGLDPAAGTPTRGARVPGLDPAAGTPTRGARVPGLDPAAGTPTRGARVPGLDPAVGAPTRADAATEVDPDAGPNTHWAPEVIHDGTRYRMYLSFIEGVPDRWEGHARHIVEYQSPDLERWTRIRSLPLSSDRVIDACVARCPDGLWRLWYKDEARDSTTWVASSPDLGDEHEWRVDGEAVGGRPHEGPNVFELGGWWWMLVDEWRGFAAYRSTDAVSWTRQGGPDAVLLGAGIDGPGPVGRHGDVVVEGDAATLYHFTHPHWTGTEIDSAPTRASRVTWLEAAPLTVRAGTLLVGGAGALS
ncbi:hypothetical protein [Herbiconiux flava]|uniref:Glycosyl hydrolases family 43 n=1 Tax=Herbiconiux flava TaxID=881268 RepID=A0A852STS0_9MICO|nr:hypothetical protein [Herbiconiux flava]NYD72152.1 hypothetical protein [Herbiconiux flava]GLK17884.1 hypothetical protein GCM10017602_23660 [Herbiconiux flava]